MQNKKGLTTILLVVVGLIWGLVFYRIFSSLSSDSGKSFTPKKTEYTGPEKIEEDTFILTLKYRDPFLGRSEQASFVNYNTSEIPATPRPVVKKPEKEKVPEITIDFSFIKYIGSVKNQATGKQVALLSINNKEDVLEEGMIRDGVKILHRTRDSVEIEFKSIKKWIRR